MDVSAEGAGTRVSWWALVIVGWVGRLYNTTVLCFERAGSGSFTCFFNGSGGVQDNTILVTYTVIRSWHTGRFLEAELVVLKVCLACLGQGQNATACDRGCMFCACI